RARRVDHRRLARGSVRGGAPPSPGPRGRRRRRLPRGRRRPGRRGARPAGGGRLMHELDPVNHVQTWLQNTSVHATSSAGESITFPRLQELLDMTAGNLSTHVRRLEDAGYVTVTKSHEGRLPVTYLELSTRGRRAFEDYTAALRAVLGGE